MVGANPSPDLSPTRFVILRLLKEWGKGTATQLSKALGISRVAVHQHLDWLKRMGWVTATTERQGRGRPAEVFRLTEAAQERFFPRRYEALVSVILKEVAMELGDEYVRDLFRRYRRWLIQKLGDPPKRLAGKVRALTTFLQQEGYLARWEETKDGFIVTLPNCPIAQVARQFPEACQSEMEALEELFQLPVHRQCHQVSGDPCCRYFIAKPKRHRKPFRKEVVRR
jgi:predicted ArsR family transcriptional regulator